MAVLVLALTARVIFVRWINDPAPKGLALLHSRAHDQEVRVPFTLRDEHIYVRASLANRTMDCCVDTGTNVLIIPASDGVSVIATGMSRPTYHIDGRVTHESLVVLPRLQIGGYELYGGTATVERARYDGADPAGEGTPVLGGAPFRQTVLTIDYARRELILRRPQYDFRLDLAARNGIVLDFDRAQKNPAMPCVAGTIDGRPSSLLVDTGFRGGCIGVMRPSRNGKLGVRGDLPRVVVSLPVMENGRKTQLTIIAPAVIYPKAESGPDASLGFEILKHFRVTIDYPRRRILLEPYPEPKSGGVKPSAFLPSSHSEQGRGKAR